MVVEICALAEEQRDGTGRPRGLSAGCAVSAGLARLFRWFRWRQGGARRSGPMIGRMHPAAVVLIIALAVLALDRLGLWAESRGWIYWRRRKPEASR